MSGAGGAQLPLGGGLPVDPRELAKLTAIQRADWYSKIGLDWAQRQAAEAAVRRVLAGLYRRPPR